MSIFQLPPSRCPCKEFLISWFLPPNNLGGKKSGKFFWKCKFRVYNAVSSLGIGVRKRVTRYNWHGIKPHAVSFCHFSRKAKNQLHARKFVPYMLKILYNPEMAKNGCYWPKMMEDDPSGWNKLLPDHPYSIPNDFTIEYKQVYAENLLKLCWKSVKILLKWPKMGIFGHFWPFLGTQSGQNISKEVNLHILVPITSI